MVTQRIKNMTPSATEEMTAIVENMKRQNINVIGLNLGEPDFNTPANINNAAKKALDDGFTKYTAVAGIPELRSAICEKFKIDNGVNYKPNEILVATGAKQALFNAIFTTCEAGDEVILPTPCWVSYVEMIKLAGAKPVFVKSDESTGFQLNIPKIAAAITAKTKAIIINNPNNPTGAVYSEDCLKELAKLVEEKDLYIISDEVYEKLIYDGVKHVCIATLLPNKRENVIIINGFSKTYAMTGWRIGYVAANETLIKGMDALQGHITSSVNSMTQIASIEALTGQQQTIEDMKKEFNERRKYLMDRIKSIPELSCDVPQGAFYILPNIEKLFGKKYKGKVLKTSVDVTNFFLEAANVAVVPGEAFQAPNNVRISYSNSMGNLVKGMNNLENALADLL
ncbi:Aspartate/prephenate aminotransferase [Sporomusa silvacetica DSM 10669]|uniref:Aminotransferase n=1 Tax=Sporomusa silvacetica DSM 10669 TaxID=1123289 RepID=A0ABZ3IU94_9FIRM|nr:pyridoxal phosphate-dependent aminotransferase [Sporomusa silvacetica]OZC19530.1 aspartate aminotransferase [Sporomusa silvacetica DSM 10669]